MDEESARFIVGVVVFGAIGWILYTCIFKDVIQRWRDGE